MLFFSLITFVHRVSTNSMWAGIKMFIFCPVDTRRVSSIVKKHHDFYSKYLKRLNE